MAVTVGIMMMMLFSGARASNAGQSYSMPCDVNTRNFLLFTCFVHARAYYHALLVHVN